MNLMMLLPMRKVNVIISPSRKDHIPHSEPNCEINFCEDPWRPLPPAAQAITSPSEGHSPLSTSFTPPVRYPCLYAGLFLRVWALWRQRFKSFFHPCYVVCAQRMSTGVIDVSLQGFPINFLVKFFKGLPQPRICVTFSH